VYNITHTSKETLAKRQDRQSLV